MSNLGFSYLSIDEDKTLSCGLDSLNRRLDDLKQSNNPDQPPLIKILERPHRSIRLPFQIDLLTHDCIHVLLGIGTYMHDEAFLIGFTMGNSQRINHCYREAYKFISHNLYPKEYGLTRKELMIFDRGYQYGESIKQPNLDRIDFSDLLDQKTSVLRQKFGIHHYGTGLSHYLRNIQVEPISFRVADALS